MGKGCIGHDLDVTSIQLVKPTDLAKTIFRRTAPPPGLPHLASCEARGDEHLKAGDVVVQRATNHAWVNRGDEPCKIAFILIDAGAKAD